MKQRLRLTLAALVSLTVPGLAAADQIPLAEISRYFDTITTAEAPFTQINADGSVSTGQLLMHRPGRMRFEYEDQDLLVIAGGQRLAIFDGRSNTRGEQYPLRETPLWLILQRNVDLTQSGMVVEHTTDGTTTRVVTQDPERPEIGYLTLIFTPDPVELRQWVVTDNTGAETTIILGNMERDEAIPAIRFSIPAEIAQREDD